jgi:transposase InsO family protein
MISLTERKQIIRWADEAVEAGARYGKVCQVLGLSERALQRWRATGEVVCDGRSCRVFTPENKLSEAEREQVLALCNSDEFAHLPPSQIVPILAEQGRYIASESTFYRILRAAGQQQHRQLSRPPRQRHKPRALTATASNQVYTWDITYLKTTVQGLFYYLYLFVDLYSRKIVGWQVFDQESSELAAELVRDIAHQEGIEPDQVYLHSDNGSPMKGATLRATLQQLGITPSFSRPSVSNDNPYSESLFRTLKYRPDQPAKPFASLTEARQWVASLVEWYNTEHRHSAIRFVTPAERHAGLDRALLEQRKAVYEAAKAQHPERWRGDTRNWDPIESVTLNPEKEQVMEVHSNVRRRPDF